MDVILAGIFSAFAPLNLAFIVLGVTLGIGVGAIPGMSAPMAIAIAVPLYLRDEPRYRDRVSARRTQGRRVRRRDLLAS